MHVSNAPSISMCKLLCVMTRHAISSTRQQSYLHERISTSHCERIFVVSKSMSSQTTSLNYWMKSSSITTVSTRNMTKRKSHISETWKQQRDDFFLRSSLRNNNRSNASLHIQYVKNAIRCFLLRQIIASFNRFDNILSRRQIRNSSLIMRRHEMLTSQTRHRLKTRSTTSFLQKSNIRLQNMHSLTTSRLHFMLRYLSRKILIARSILATKCLSTSATYVKSTISTTIAISIITCLTYIKSTSIQTLAWSENAMSTEWNTRY